ncbi:hypothetical protein AQUCO_00200355v1 [Aquilegia coerulea]|uniref:Response regulatory domain-containing protein n=1 Tax=Aquilegia coerulea TaxID=218851 RepID=A0A2G5F313_AQUCA|nr:hypothetical protein AQUCO_00200355v1 [Aquilegia coerulea]
MEGFNHSGIVETDQELHVLAVDDSLVDRKVIERLLKISSCKVTVVDSGRRALQYLGLDGDKNSVGFNGLKVNLIITDYWMPGMTGYELLKKIKESSTFKEIPVVIMSSENVLPRINRCLEEGAEEFIVKPVKLSDVKRLKDYIMREEIEVEDINQRKGSSTSQGALKRKLDETHHDNENENDDDDILFSSAPSSPLSTLSSSPLNSPSRRLKTSEDDDDYSD